MTSEGLPPVAKPDHVPKELVVAFDFYDLPGSGDDVQLAYRAFQQSAPDIFWTPYNGGHWVATRAEDIEEMQRDYTRFSTRRVTLPKTPDSMPSQVPLEYDPPFHTPLRKPLTAALLPKAINPMEAEIRMLAVKLIEGFIDRGECEFVGEFGQVLPIMIFLEMVNLPLEDRHMLLPITENAVRGRTAEIRMKAQHDVFAYLGPTVQARRENPGQDLLSQIVNVQVDGGRIGDVEAVSYATLVLFGGLDTVASMLAFVARFLALNPGHRRQLCDNLGNEPLIRNAIEELLRRHGIANTAREITHDFSYKDLQFKAGDMILPPNMLFGLDERKIDNPLKVDFSRPAPIRHATFGHGPHTCPGATLARRELKVFLEEWLSRIPEFGIKPGTTPVLETGMVNGVLKLELAWPTRG